MGELLHVSSSPHIRSKVTTDYLMKMVIVALMPATVAGVCFFGWKALLLVCLSVATCVATEGIYETLMHKPLTIWDGSAVITGLLLGLNLPASAPWWIPVIGGVFAILIVKQLFGGLGQNFMNPALGARCFLLLSFTSQMTSFVYDGVTGATPLAQLKAGNTVNTMDMLIGRIPGTIGETSVIAILIGAIILILLGVITLRIPAAYLITFAVFMLIFGKEPMNANYLVAELCGGGLMLGAFFMATDYVTSPITPGGQIIYGICCGLLTGIFRCFGANAEGVSFAIILSNILVPIIEKFTIPRAFGLAKEAKKNE